MAIKLQEIKIVTSFSIFPLGADFFTHKNLKKNDHQLRSLVQTFYLRWPCYCVPGNHMGWISACNIDFFFPGPQEDLSQKTWVDHLWVWIKCIILAHSPGQTVHVAVDVEDSLNGSEEGLISLLSLLWVPHVTSSSMTS